MVLGQGVFDSHDPKTRAEHISEIDPDTWHGTSTSYRATRNDNTRMLKVKVPKSLGRVSSDCLWFGKLLLGTKELYIPLFQAVLLTKNKNVTSLENQEILPNNFSQNKCTCVY